MGWAQSTADGAIGGVVSDPSGAVIPGATVTVRNQANNATATAQTGGNGRYIVIHLRPGVYDVEVTATGLIPAKQSGLIVEVGRVTPLTSTLAVGGDHRGTSRSRARRRWSTPSSRILPPT